MICDRNIVTINQPTLMLTPARHVHCQYVYAEVNKRESTKLCYEFGSEPNLKRLLKIFGGFLLMKCGARKLPIFGLFYDKIKT